ncbi:hypothetical protein CH368_19005 [Leptospira levettii]|nr:hypothetical protein CH368_19005 [Leptospira levettii]
MDQVMFELGIVLMCHSLILFAVAWGRSFLRAVSQQVLRINLKQKRSVEVVKFIPLGGRR